MAKAVNFMSLDSAMGSSFSPLLDELQDQKRDVVRNVMAVNVTF